MIRGQTAPRPTTEATCDCPLIREGVQARDHFWAYVRRVVDCGCSTVAYTKNWQQSSMMPSAESRRNGGTLPLPANDSELERLVYQTE